MIPTLLPYPAPFPNAFAPEASVGQKRADGPVWLDRGASPRTPACHTFLPSFLELSWQLRAGYLVGIVGL